ncbi:hypothetical protein D1007_45397 [Hordeum vulgare]|nr:hypothetical protein D1007_45397 [Hordeum vulgare]
MEWCSKFPEFRVRNELPRHSDHRPLVLDMEYLGKKRMGGVGSFKFEARWLREDGCDLVVQEAWRRMCEGGVTDVAATLKGVARDLSRWSRDFLGDTEKKFKDAKKDLEVCRWQAITPEKVAEEVRLRCLVDHLEDVIDIKWCKRAHVWCLKEGDMNTNFFLRYA